MGLEEARRIWGEEWSCDIEFINETISQLDLSKDSRILDVGTGQGIMAICLALNGFDVLTGEPKKGSEELAEYEREQEELEWHQEHGGHSGHGYSDWREAAKAAGVEHKIRHQHFNAEELFFPTRSVDAVFLYDALQHIHNREVALGECIRVAKASGIVCVIEANDHGIEYFRETEGFEIDKVDPRDLIEGNTTKVEVLSGKFANAYVFRKTAIPS